VPGSAGVLTDLERTRGRGSFSRALPSNLKPPTRGGPNISWQWRKMVDTQTEHYLRLARHAATLTRLKLRIENLRQSSANGRGFHLRAACTAYDQALIIAAGELGLDPEAKVPLSTSDRLGLEAELALAGLRW